MALSLYDPTLTSIHDYWKNHSFGYEGASLVAQTVKNLPAMDQEDPLISLTWLILLVLHCLKKAMASPVSLPGEFLRQKSLQATVQGVAESDTAVTNTHTLVFVDILCIYCQHSFSVNSMEFCSGVSQCG